MKLTEIQKTFISKKLKALRKSKFRSSFKLTQKEKTYLHTKKLPIIEKHCEDFIEKRLVPYPTPNDGKQTPMKGHPAFIAQHATATCCRNCLKKWHKVPADRALNEKERLFIKALIIEWIKEEIK